MKYINREYGFEGRPPFFRGYTEIKSKGPSKNLFKYPSKEYASYGLHYSQPNGALLCGKLGTIWGVKVTYQRLGKWVEAKDFLNDIGNFFAANKNGNFAYFNHGDITASFMKYSQNKLVMLISGMSKVKVRLEFYPIAPKNALIKEENGELIKGQANERAVIPGTIKLNDFNMEIRDRYEVEFTSTASRKEYFLAKGYFPAASVINNGSSIVYEYNLDSQFSRIMFFLAIGDKYIYNNLPDIEELNEGTSKTELVFTTEKIAGSGILGENISSAISRSVWHKIYDPYLQRALFVEDRNKCSDYYSYDSTELATGALIQALIGEYQTGMEQLEICVKDKILGAITAWIFFCRTRNHKIIDTALPKLIECTPLDGKLIKADKMTLREIAYKQMESPLKDIKNDDIYSLDMSCYKLIALDIMCRMALITDNKMYKKIYNAKQTLKKAINQTLFNEKLGLYMDRYLNGDFVSIYGANCFLPLAAGAVDDIDRLERVILNLKDPKKFGGDFMVSTLVKSHPLYGKKAVNNYGKEIYPYENYRGMIVPVLNYLIFTGLKRYGVSETESALAKSSAILYSNILKRYNITPNYYLPSKRLKSKNSVDNSLSGNLMGLIGMSEMIDVEYFRNDMRAAISFGTLIEGDHRLANAYILGHKFSISISDSETSLLCDEEEFFKGNGGKFIVRQFVENETGAEFIIYSKEDITLNITLPALAKKDKKANYIFNVEKGKFKVVIDKNNEVKPAKLQFNT